MIDDRNLSSRPGVSSVAIVCLMLAVDAQSAAAQTTSAPVIAVGEPDGFADLTADQTLLVDVFFGGVRRGEATVITTRDGVRITNPAGVLALLPQLTDSAAIEAALAAPNLPANSGRACSATADRTTCGRLTPDLIGVILDRDRLRLDVFLNPRVLAVHENVEEQYLPAPPPGVSMINAVGAVLSGRTGSGKNYHNLQDQLMLADGQRRVRADVSLATGYGLGAERLAFEWDQPGMRYSAGALWAPGNELTGRRKLLGVGVETQIDTRLDKDEILGSPVVVYLDHRARIDVVRDGRVLNSAIYEAGNQQIDTSNLPEGSYEIALRIEESGRASHEERRFFTKSRRIPSVGRTDFFVFGGLLVDSTDIGSLKPSRHPFFQGGMARRLNEKMVIEGELQATDHGAAGEVGARLLTQWAQIRAAVVADGDGRYGGLFQIGSGASSQFNFNLDLRHMESHRPYNAPTTYFVEANNPLAPDRYRLGTSYSQASGVISYSLANIRFLGVLSYRDQHGQAAGYSIGPSLQWDILRAGRFTFTLRGDMVVTERGTSEFAGISLRVLGAHTSLTALGGARGSTIRDDDRGDGPVAELGGTWNTRAAGGELALGAGIDHEPRQQDIVMSSEFHHPIGSVAGDFIHSDGDSSGVSQYSLGMQSTVVAGAGAVRVVGRTTTDSMIVARIDGAGDGDRFEVLVNEQAVGTIVGSRPFSLALPTYRAYDVRIRPKGNALLSYDSAARSIALYPGTVIPLEWKVVPVAIQFGRLVASDGTPMRYASISGKGVWSETDENGFFQLEAPEGVEVTITTRDGRSFAASLPRADAVNGIARLGIVQCCGLNDVRLSALELLKQRGEGPSK